MPLSDFLWACPACGEDRALSNPESRCPACGTRFLRGADADIRAVAPDGTETTRSAAAWLERLPEPATLLESDPVRTARVSIRPATGEAKVFGAAGFLNRIEIFGDEVPGTLTLHRDSVSVRYQPPAEAARAGAGAVGPPGEAAVDGAWERAGESAGDAAESWPLESLSGVQTSSKSLQLKRKRRPLVAFRFLDDSVYLWEQLLRAALRDFYGRTGRGEIREFQPRIETARSGS